MAPQTFTRQNGPQSTPPGTGRQPNRGGIRKRNGGPVRVDKDGDLEMNDGETNKGRGGGGRRAGGRGGRGAPDKYVPGLRVNSARINRKPRIPQDLKHYPHSDRRIPSGPRHDFRGSRPPLPRVRELSPAGLEQIIVRGFDNSGVPSHAILTRLIGILERRVSPQNALARDVVRIRKSRLEGDALIISVAKEDVSKFTRLHQQKVAGSILDVRVGEDAKLELSPIAVTLRAVLVRRYDPSLKLLNLSHLKADSELVNLGLFSTPAREAKFFPVLMTVCDGMFTTQEQKVEAIASVTLAGNALTSITSVTALAETFPALKNLDLSDNRLQNLSALAEWRSKFRQLDHLVLSGNPLEMEEPSYKDEILKWYPTLKMLNSLQVRSTEDVAAFSKTKTPILVSGPRFHDEGGIAENFIKQFFPAYDSERSGLIDCYYDADTTFSLSVNTQAPKGSEIVGQATSTWDAYIRRSRNLDKVTHLPARMARVYNGAKNIRECWLSLPSTRHPNILTEPQKWCIECEPAPGVPDPTGQSLGGVGGLFVTIHGEFSEVDVSTGQPTCVRSFDRTFVLGPGTGASGVRVVCETLVLRRYGGSEAWKPVCPPPVQYQVQLPPGFGAPAPGKTEEQLQHEMLAVELGTRTNMTLEYSGMCLEQSGWSLERAEMAFHQAKGQLPAEAFIPSL